MAQSTTGTASSNYDSCCRSFSGCVVARRESSTSTTIIHNGAISSSTSSCANHDQVVRISILIAILSSGIIDNYSSTSRSRW